MAWATDDKGPFAFPTIINQNGKLVELPVKEAMAYALKTGELKRFSSPQEAEAYAAGSWKKTAKSNAVGSPAARPIQAPAPTAESDPLGIRTTPANLESTDYIPAATVQQGANKGVFLPFDEGFVGKGRPGVRLPRDPGNTTGTVESPGPAKGVAGKKYKGYGPQGEAGGIVGPFPKWNQPGGIIGTGDPLVDEFLKTREGQEALHQYGGYGQKTDREKDEYMKTEGRRRLLQMLGAQ
jgi:hypothetical protein